MGTAFHLALGIVSLQANVTFHGYDISSGLRDSFTAG